MNETTIKPWFVFFMIGLSLVAGMGIQKWRSRSSPEKVIKAIVDTSTAPFKQLGPSVQAKGNVTTQAEIDAMVKTRLGSAVAQEIQRQGGQAVASLQAQGTVGGMLSEVNPIPTIPVPEGISGTAIQDRGGLPPLTKAEFHYSPSSGLKVAWGNQAELFDLSFATARTDKDGLRAYARLSRTVNGQHEDIHLTNAEAFFPASEVTRIAPLAKGDVGIGPFLDQRTGRTKPLLYTSKRWTRSLSTGAFYVPNVGYALIVTNTFGGQK